MTKEQAEYVHAYPVHATYSSVYAAQDSSDFAMRDASPPNSPDPRRPSTFDGLTNEFGKILLEHVQTSHDQINKMMSAFMSQQNEVQERFQ